MKQLPATVCALLFATLGAKGQAPSSNDLIALSEKLQAAISAENWKQAGELSSALKKATEAARDQSFSKGNGALVSQILNWLPVDTETLAVSSGTVPFPIPEVRGELPQASAVATGYLLSLIEGVQGGDLAKKLSGQTVSMSVVAARHFQQHEPGPNGALPLGIIAYQGCGFFAFASAVPETAFVALTAGTVAGRVTWTAKGKQYTPASDALQSGEPHFLTLLKPNLLMVCNDRQFYTTVTSRFASPAEDRGLPEALPEWKHVDQSAPFWAIRHYKAERVSEDPSMSSIGEFQEGSIGLSFQIGSPKDTLRLQFLGKTGQSPFKEMIDDQQFAGIESKLISPGMWQLSAALNQPSDMMFIFLAMGMLGFEALV